MFWNILLNGLEIISIVCGNIMLSFYLFFTFLNIFFQNILLKKTLKYLNLSTKITFFGNWPSKLIFILNFNKYVFKINCKIYIRIAQSCNYFLKQFLKTIFENHYLMFCKTNIRLELKIILTCFLCFEIYFKKLLYMMLYF